MILVTPDCDFYWLLHVEMPEATYPVWVGVWSYPWGKDGQGLGYSADFYFPERIDLGNGDYYIEHTCMVAVNHEPTLSFLALFIRQAIMKERVYYRNTLVKRWLE